MAFLFAYDTLQQPAVQLATFGRHLEGTPEMLSGYALAPVTNPSAVRTDGSPVRSVAYRTGNPAHRVAGFLYQLNDAEVSAADDYVGAAMVRLEVSLLSGTACHMFVCAEPGCEARAA